MGGAGCHPATAPGALLGDDVRDQDCATYSFTAPVIADT